MNKKSKAHEENLVRLFTLAIVAVRKGIVKDVGDLGIIADHLLRIGQESTELSDSLTTAECENWFRTHGENQALSKVLSTIENWEALAPSTSVNEKTIRKIAYTRAEAAKATGISFNCIAEAVALNQLPATLKGRQWIILETDLMEWLTH